MGGKGKGQPPMTVERARIVYDDVTAVRERTGLDINKCFAPAGWGRRTYYKAKKMLGIKGEKRGRRKRPAGSTKSYAAITLNNMSPGNRMVPGIHGMIRIETVIGLEALNISREFKGKAPESEMREILRQRIYRMTGGKVQVRF